MLALRPLNKLCAASLGVCDLRPNSYLSFIDKFGHLYVWNKVENTQQKK